MGVSRRHVQNLIEEAETQPRTARWREKRDFVNLSPGYSPRKTIRIIPHALGIPLDLIEH